MTVASDDMIAYDTVVLDNMYDSKITTYYFKHLSPVFA